ncbi:MAG: HlyD family secretion protein [Sphingomonas sp.]|uniref:HlyD family secretion protein n=1 Tax=Sphingomonas sp. TaxID=28214 RepID=UPI0025E37168|nr:HlyD family secretion protein [Sphingomonas sp.]MBX3564966.1 HlyD family secretion protein [Sphingomonas sp.]
MADADPKFNKASEETIVVEPVAAPTEEVTVVKAKRSWLRPLLMFGVPVLLLAIVGYFYMASGRTVSTDNAYVSQDKVSVSSDVAGRIVNVAVKENQIVKKGDLLFEIDPEPYRIAVASAQAQIAAAQVNVQTLQTSYAGTGASIQAARDSLQAAQQDYSRQAELMKAGFTTRARLEQSEHGVEQARAAVSRAQSDAAEARSKLSTGSAGENPQLAAARVQLAKAQLDLSRTKVYAPVDGIVSQSDRLQVGQMMMTGLPAVTIVRGSGAWLEANFKETDLNKMRVGQKAEVSFDAYPGLKLKAHVASIGAGTGSEFSVLPAQNANGNWVKVTQRVPVRIAIDENSPRPLIAGLSADVTVNILD